MNRVRTAVQLSGGAARFVPVWQLWETAGVLADALPLDRDSPYPRSLRRAGHYARLLTSDRALTNREGSAVLVIRQTPWPLAIGAAAFAAMVSPRLSPVMRRALVVGGVVFAIRRRRLADYVRFQRQTRRLAPHSLVIDALVARSAGSAVPWINEVLRNIDARGGDIAFIATLPGSRRDRARERIYTRQFGFDVATRGGTGDHDVTILVRHPPVADASKST
jgi:hypothetical protein